jgi:Transglutaminase-like superfamily
MRQRTGDGWEIEVGMNGYLQPDSFCNFNKKNVSGLVFSLIPSGSEIKKTTGILFNFVKNNIWFSGSPNKTTDSGVTINLGNGNANSKSILLVSMLRCAGIPAIFSAHTVWMDIYSKLTPNYLLRFQEKNYLHLRPLVRINRKWVCLEGCAIDEKYLNTLIRKFSLSCLAKGFGFSEDCSLSKLKANFLSWDGESDICCIQNSITSNIGEIVDAEKIISEHTKGGIIKRFIDRTISNKINKIRTTI